MATLTEIQNNLREGKQLSPREFSDMHIQLAGEFSFWSSMLEDREQDERLFWEEHLSLTGIESERKWKHTSKGTEQKIIKHRLQAIAKMLSSINQRLRLMMEESRNTM